MVFKPKEAFYVCHNKEGQNNFLHMSQTSFVYLLINYYNKTKNSNGHGVPMPKHKIT